MSETKEKIDHKLELRPATADDADLIYRFIVKLAEYEGFEDQVECTPEQLHHALFEGKPSGKVVIAEVDDIPQGFALFYYNFSTYKGTNGLYLEDLYVNPDCRGLGIGTKLLAYLANEALENDCQRMEWSVLDDNEPAIGFYRSLGAFSKDERMIFRLNGDPLRSLASELEG